MKVIMIGAVAVFLLGGGGAGAYFFFNKPAEASANTLSEHEKAEAEAAKAAHNAMIKPAIYVELNPLILPIVDENGISQTVSLVVSVEVADQMTADQVKNLQPRLHDAFLQDMYGVLSRKAVMSGGVIQVDKIKERLQRVCQTVVGEGAVKDVLLQVVHQRRV